MLFSRNSWILRRFTTPSVRTPPDAAQIRTLHLQNVVPACSATECQLYFVSECYWFHMNSLLRTHTGLNVIPFSGAWFLSKISTRTGFTVKCFRAFGLPKGPLFPQSSPPQCRTILCQLSETDYGTHSSRLPAAPGGRLLLPQHTDVFL
jgi:hypothetical protein